MQKLRRFPIPQDSAESRGLEKLQSKDSKQSNTVDTCFSGCQQLKVAVDDPHTEIRYISMTNWIVCKH